MNKREIYSMVFRHEISAEEALKLLENSVNEEECVHFPLSSIQKPLWLSNIMYPDNSAYNLSVPIIINEEVNEEILLKTCSYIVSLHGNLRTVFSNCTEIENGEPYQTVREDNGFAYEYFDITNETFGSQKEIVLSVYKRPFELAKDYGLRVCNFKIENEKYLVLLVTHHILADGPSLTILASHFVEAYCTYKMGETIRIQKPKANYKEFVEWQENMLLSDFGQEAEEFWMKKLNNDFNGIDLPKENLQNKEITFEGETILKGIDYLTLKKLRETADEFGVSLYVLTLGAFFVLLNRYSGQEKLQVGTPMYGRPSSKFSDCIGFFSNTVPVFTEIPSEEKFKVFVSNLKKEIMDIMRYSTYPFLNVAGKLGKTTDNMYTIVFAVQSFLKELGRHQLDNFGSKSEQDTELVNSIQQEGVFDIFLELQEQQDNAALAIKYKKGSFSKEFIDQFGENYIYLLNDICSSPEKLIYQLDCVCKEEKNYLLNVINNTDKKFEQLCVHEIIDRYGDMLPNKTAVVFKGSMLTYAQLRDESNYLAHLLVERGVKKGDIVGVYMDRSAEVIISMLALFKIGAVYLPYDTKLPLDRFSYIIGETAMKIVLTNDNRLQFINDQITKLSVESELRNRKSSISGKAYKSETSLEDLAYMIYTSGSTGNPKGVQVWQNSLSNIIQSMIIEPGVSSSDYTITIASISFDMSLLEILPILCAGGTIEMLTSDIIDDQIALTKKLHDIPVTYFCATPSLYEILFVTGFNSKTMTRAWVAGDALNNSLAQKMIDLYGVVWNMCGPTEAAIITSIQKITDARKVGIGKPIHNYQIYILDSYHQLLPKGAKGELYIGGAGINQPCYYKQDELNSKKFIQNPFLKDSYLHCSGDLVSFMDDDNLKYYCRIDGMVKFRGLRIELEEIDNQILKIDYIRNSATVIRKDSSNHSEIVTFVILKSIKSEIDASAISAIIGKWLPAYMLPSYYVILEEMPLNVNAKINRKYLSTEKINDILLNYKGYILDGTSTKEVMADNKEIPEDINKEETCICTSVEPVAKRIDVECNPDELLSFVNDQLKRSVIEIVDLPEKDIGEYTPFSNMEFDSLRFVKLAVSIKEQFSIEISPVIFNNLKNISSLAVYLVSNFSAEVSGKYCELSIGSFKKEDVIEVEACSVEYQKENSFALKEQNKDIIASMDNDIAIIGVSFKLPFGDNEADVLEQICSNSKVFEACTDRESTNLNNKSGYFVQDIWDFDNEYFNYSKQDSSFIDPQYRILLHLTAELFADAGYKTSEIANQNIGVFLGTTREEYKELLYSKGYDECDIKFITNAYLASNISTHFNLDGPAKVLDATLSSSQSLDDAIDSIAKGECKMAIAGGVNLLLSDERFKRLSSESRLAKNNANDMFGEDVSGVIPAEGAAVLLLKPLSEAVKDKDKVYAVIKKIQSHSNNGRLVPRQASLIELLTQVYSDSKINGVDYIDSIGLGTKFSAENEYMSYANVFGRNIPQRNDKKIVVGSSRSQFGDMEAVSVYAAIIKIICMMQNRIIPASIYRRSILNKRISETPSEHIEFLTKLHPWNSDNSRMAAITEIGCGGRNTHIVLGEYTPKYEVKKSIPISLNREKCNPPDKTLFKLIADKKPILLGSGNIGNIKDGMVEFWKSVNEIKEPKSIGNLLEDSNSRVTHLLIKLQSVGNMIEVVVKGKGKPLILIPGFGLAASQFIPQFSDDSFNRQMIVIHMPGVGLSEACDDVSFEAISSYYMEALDMLGINTKIDLLGTSWGGVLAQFIGIKYEERCNSLILANTSAELTVDSHVGLKELVYDDFESAGASDARKLFDDSTCITDEMALKYEAVLHSGHGKTGDFLSKINIPTLILAGAKDKILPVELSERMNREIRHSELHIFETSGHSSNLSVPEEFNAVCKEFLEKYNQ